MRGIPKNSRQVDFDFALDEATTEVASTPKASELKSKKSKRTGAFTDNMSLPVHRWFRYSAGFSAEWVEQLIDKHQVAQGDIVLDPFAGSGTTLLAAQTKGVDALGAERHEFVRRIANAK